MTRPRPPGSYRLRRAWPWLLLGLVVAYAAAHWATRVVPDTFSPGRDNAGRAFRDFDVYHTAARQLAVGRSVYAATDTLPRLPCVDPEALAYLYTPFLAGLLQPWTPMSPCAAERAWLVVNLTACAALPWLLVVVVGRARSPAWWALALGLVAAPMATLETVSLGQVNALVLALTLGCVVLAGRGRTWPAAGLLALAAGLKVAPVALGLVALAPGRRRLLAAMAAATALVVGIAFAAAPASTPAQFLRALDQFTVNGVATTNNASWVGAAVRALDPGPGDIRLLVRANLLLVAAAAALAWWRARGDGGALRLVALGFALSVALSPVIEAHHQMLLYPCLMVLAVAASREPGPGRKAAAWAGLALLMALLNSRGLVPLADADSLVAHLLVKPAGLALWALIAWLLCLPAGRLEQPVQHGAPVVPAYRCAGFWNTLSRHDGDAPGRSPRHRHRRGSAGGS